MSKIKLFSLLWSLLMLTSLVSAAVYEDAEDGNTNGWSVYDGTPPGAKIFNVYDSSKGSKVIRLQSTGTANGFILGGREWEPGKWADTSSTTIKWSMKFSESYVVYIRVMTTKGPRYIYYTARSISLGGSGQYVHLGLGASSRNGTWQTITRDLQADLAQFQPGNTITAINGFLIRGSGLVDDIEVGVSDYLSSNPKTFNKIKLAGHDTTNIYGDLMVIGNQSLCWKGLYYRWGWRGTEGSACKNPPSNASNNSYIQRQANLDPQAMTAGYLNSTSADLDIHPDDKIVEAWLFAYGRLMSWDTTPRSSAQTIALKTPTSNHYINLRANSTNFNWMVGGDGTFDYGVAINVTHYVQKSGTYWVADLKATEASNQGSGWSIVVIVEDPTGQRRTLKNISLYNGFNGVYKYDSSYPATVTSNITRFYTPRSGKVKSNLIVMAGESDRALQDAMRVTKKDGTEVDIQDTLKDSNNVQNGTISKNGTNVTNRNPNYENTLGIDIDEIDVSHIIQNEQNATKITIDSFGDRIFLNMYGFATELYTPKLCYDYSVRMGDHIKVPSKNNDINTSYWKGEPLVLKVFIHNLDSDFDLTHSRLKINFSKQNKLQFLDPYATVSPPNINAYLPAITTGPGEISIGENNTPEGGTIGANISLYAKMGYKILNAEALNNHFELELNTQIQFDPQAAPVSYNFTSAGSASNSNHIGLCPSNPVYNPVYERFNIERADSTFAQATKVRYPLYTQVAGKAFDVSVASYGGEDFEDPLVVDNTSVDLELIDAGNFDNNSSAGYDNICEEPASVSSSDTFVKFNNTSRVHVNLKTTLSNFNNDVALRSAAFRVWALTKKDSNTSSNKRLTVKHHCADKSKESCFKTVYDTNYKDAEDAQLHLCASACGANPHGCYACLKKYFATPFCSRDNFSIRPESFRIAIADANESTDANITTWNTLSQNSTTLVNPKLALAAGYTYRWDINATLYKSNAFALGYYNNAFRAESNISDIEYIKYQRIVAPLLFTDKAACTDKTHSTLGLKMQNGTLVGGQNFSHDNVGKYEMYMHDSNWTIVDQASYPYKTTFDNACKNNPSSAACNDCIVNSTDVTLEEGKLGCDIDSYVENNDAYIKLPLTFHPYAFSVNMPLRRRPDRSILFMNDLSDDYYGNVLSEHLSSATSFEGNLSAVGKQGNVLSNFTNSCVASDVTLHVAHNMQADVDENAVPLQQYLEIGVDTTDHTEEKNATLTVPKRAFADENKGQTTLQLHTTLKKPLGFGQRMNPVEVNYASLKATAPDENSSAHMQDDFVPEGKEAYDVNTTYVYGKVTPWQRLYKNIEDNSKLTPIYVDVFCDDADKCPKYGLTEDSLGKEEVESGWKRATIFNTAELGTTDINVSYLAEKNADPHINGLTATVAQDVNFDDPKATQNDVNISVGNAKRNSMIKVKFDPVPWLKYDKKVDYYRLHFVAPSTWAGVGKTGHVTNTSSSNTQNNRMNW